MHCSRVLSLPLRLNSSLASRPYPYPERLRHQEPTCLRRSAEGQGPCSSYAVTCGCDSPNSPSPCSCEGRSTPCSLPCGPWYHASCRSGHRGCYSRNLESWELQPLEWLFIHPTHPRVLTLKNRRSVITCCSSRAPLVDSVLAFELF